MKRNFNVNARGVLSRKIAVAITPAAGVAGDATLGIAGTLAQAFEFDGLSRMAFGRDSVGLVGGGLANTEAGRTYDSINRILKEQQAAGGNTRYVTHHTWTSLPPTGLTFPGGRHVAMAFDALYRKNGVGEGTNTSNIAVWNFFGGRIATVALGNNITTSFMNNAQDRSAVQPGQTTPPWGDITSDHLGYDGSGRSIGKRHLTSGGSTLVGFTTTYDPSSNKLFERALHAESRSNLYTVSPIDSMDRLTQYSRGVLASGGASITTPISLPSTNKSQAYALDGLGNWSNTVIVPETGATQTQVRTHNKLNQVTAAGGNTILYDHGNNTGVNASRGNGNIVADGGPFVYFYDALNRLVMAGFDSSTPIGSYAYDALNRRTERIVNGADIGVISGNWRYLYDGAQIVEEFDVTAGSTFIEYVWGQYVDELVQLKAYAEIGEEPLAAGTYYLLSDLLYRSAALTDSSGAIVETYDTDAYGDTIVFNNPGTDGQWFTDDDGQASWSACRYVFTGREFDWETGNYFYRGRYYEPGLGRFMGRDLFLPPGANLYPLAAGGVTSVLDPNGLQATHPASNPFGSLDPSVRDYLGKWGHRHGDTGLLIGLYVPIISQGCIGIVCTELGTSFKPSKDPGDPHFPDVSHCYETLGEANAQRDQMAKNNDCCKSDPNVGNPQVFSFLFDDASGTTYPNGQSPVPLQAWLDAYNAIRNSGGATPSFDFGWFVDGMWWDANHYDQPGSPMIITGNTPEQWAKKGYKHKLYCVACDKWSRTPATQPSTPATGPSRPPAPPASPRSRYPYPRGRQ